MQCFWLQKAGKHPVRTIIHAYNYIQFTIRLALTQDHREGHHIYPQVVIWHVYIPQAKVTLTKELLNFWQLRKSKREKNLSFVRNGSLIFCKTGKIFSKKWALDQKSFVPFVVFRGKQRKFPDPPSFLHLHLSLSAKKSSKLDIIFQLNTTPTLSRRRKLHLHSIFKGILKNTFQYNICLFAISLTPIYRDFQIFSMVFMLLQLFPGLWSLKCKFSFLSVGFLLMNSHSAFFLISFFKAPRIV